MDFQETPFSVFKASHIAVLYSSVSFAVTSSSLSLNILLPSYSRAFAILLDPPEKSKIISQPWESQLSHLQSQVTYLHTLRLKCWCMWPHCPNTSFFCQFLSPMEAVPWLCWPQGALTTSQALCTYVIISFLDKVMELRPCTYRWLKFYNLFFIFIPKL